MGLSITVTTSKEYTPVFPKKCIVCHEPPDSTIKIARSTTGLFWTIVFPLLWVFGWSRTTVPICRKCKPRFLFERWGREGIAWIMTFTFLWFALPYMKNWNGFQRRLVWISAGLLLLSPWIVVEVFWPRLIDVTEGSEGIDYNFKSREYASEFRQLNGKRVLKSDLD